MCCLFFLAPPSVPGLWAAKGLSWQRRTQHWLWKTEDDHCLTTRQNSLKHWVLSCVYADFDFYSKTCLCLLIKKNAKVISFLPPSPHVKLYFICGIISVALSQSQSCLTSEVGILCRTLKTWCENGVTYNTLRSNCVLGGAYSGVLLCRLTPS